MLLQGCTETTFSTNDELVFQSQKCVFVLAIAVQSTENEEAQAVVFSFNYDTPALVPISKLIWNIKVDDIDPQQFTNNVTSNSDCVTKQIELYHQTD